MVNASAPRNDLLGSAKCGGTLVGPSMVLTARHCIDDLDPARLDVVIGAENICRTAEVRGERIRVSAVRTAEPATLDAAVLVLSQPAKTPPLAAPTTPEKETGRYVAVGWGSTGRSPTSCHRQTVELTAGAHDACESGRKAAPRWASTTQFCGVPVTGADRNTCSGDSGGPVFHLDGNALTLFAMVSWGTGCDVSDTGFYTRLHDLQPWLTTTGKLIAAQS
ncbi:trypsin-like serine protease [Kribbella sp. NPDC056345]|uniref:S1 family peptidase n=1 Tax=Kribbella sp. NPDC056345 TaxID=3345789 RepID=UPI0035DF0DBE